jgi:hypothetical protein
MCGTRLAGGFDILFGLVTNPKHKPDPQFFEFDQTTCKIQLENNALPSKGCDFQGNWDLPWGRRLVWVCPPNTHHVRSQKNRFSSNLKQIKV